MATLIEPAWIAHAKKHIGTKEIRGPRHEPKILGWWRLIRRGGIRDDETPWCSAFVGAMFELSGVPSTRFESAKSWASWGRPLDRPVYGCVVVLAREGGGHVGFLLGYDILGNLLVLGGNQADEVNIRAFPRKRVLAYRWPDANVLAPIVAPPLMASAPVSTGEA